MSTAEPSAPVPAEPDSSPVDPPLSPLDDASPELVNDGQDSVTPVGPDAPAGFATFSNAARGNTVHLQNGKNFKIPGTHDPLLKKGKKATSGFGAYAKSRSTEALTEVGNEHRDNMHDSVHGDTAANRPMNRRSAADSVGTGSPAFRRRAESAPSASPKVARLIMTKGAPRVMSPSEESEPVLSENEDKGDNGDGDRSLSPLRSDNPTTSKSSKSRFKLFGSSRTKAKDSTRSSKSSVSCDGDDKKKKRNPVKAIKKWFKNMRGSGDDGSGAGPATPDPDEDLTIEVPDGAEHPVEASDRPRGFESVHRKNPLYGDGSSRAETSSEASTEDTAHGGGATAVIKAAESGVDVSVSNDSAKSVPVLLPVIENETENETENENEAEKSKESTAEESIAARPDSDSLPVAEGQGNAAENGDAADATESVQPGPLERTPSAQTLSPSRKGSYNNLDLDAVMAAPRLDNSSALARGRLSTRGMSKRKPTMKRRTTLNAKRSTAVASPDNGDQAPKPLPEPESGLSPVKPLELSPVKKAAEPGLAAIVDAAEASPAVLADVAAVPEASPAVAGPGTDAATAGPGADAALAPVAPVKKSKLELARERVAREKAEVAKTPPPAVQMRPRAATSAPGGARPVSMLQKQQKDNRRMSFGIAAELNSILGGRGGGRGRGGRGRNMMSFPSMGASPNKALAKFANEAKQVSPIRTGDGVAAAKDLFEANEEPESAPAAGELLSPGTAEVKSIAEGEEPVEQIAPKVARPSLTPMFLGEIHTKLGIKPSVRPESMAAPTAGAAPDLEVDEDGLPATRACAEETEAANDESNIFFKDPSEEAPTDSADGADATASAVLITEAVVDTPPDAPSEVAVGTVPEGAPDAADEVAEAEAEEHGYLDSLGSEDTEASPTSSVTVETVPEGAPDAAAKAAVEAVPEGAPDAAAAAAAAEAALEAVPEATPEAESKGSPTAAAALGAELTAAAAEPPPSPLVRAPTLIPSKGTDPESLRAFNLSREPTTRTAAGIAFIEEQRRLREQQNALFGGDDDDADDDGDVAAVAAAAAAAAVGEDDDDAAAAAAAAAAAGEDDVDATAAAAAAGEDDDDATAAAAIVGEDDDPFIQVEEPLARPKSILKIADSKASDIGELSAEVADLKAELNAAGPASPRGNAAAAAADDDDDVPIDSAFSQLATELNAAGEAREPRTPKLGRKKKSGSTPEKAEALADAKAKSQLMADEIADQLEIDTATRSRANSTSRLRLSAMPEEEEEEPDE